VAKVSRAFPAARAAMDYRLRVTEVAYVQQSAEYLPAIGDTASSYFVNTESAVVAPISRNVGLKVGYVIRFNSEPPIRNNVQLRTTDTFFSSGLTLTF
jgi:putative salt-induced outer membrane protein